MEQLIIPAPPYVQLERIYCMQATIKSFKGRRDVVAHIFRYAPDTSELANLRAMNLIAKPDQETPIDASEEQALMSILEAFTAEEGNATLAFLQERYAEHFTKIFVFPLDLPIPMGVVPYASIPEGRGMGFIHFDAVKDYPLPFGVRGFYDLNNHELLTDEDMPTTTTANS